MSTEEYALALLNMEEVTVAGKWLNKKTYVFLQGSRRIMTLRSGSGKSIRFFIETHDGKVYAIAANKHFIERYNQRVGFFDCENECSLRDFAGMLVDIFVFHKCLFKQPRICYKVNEQLNLIMVVTAGKKGPLLKTCWWKPTCYGDKLKF